MNYTFLSIFKAIPQSYLDRKGNDEELKKHLKNKNINDLNLAKEDEYLKIPQNLLFIYQGLIEKKLINKIAVIDYLRYLEIIYKNEEEEEKEKEEEKEEEKDEKEEEKNESEEKSDKDEESSEIDEEKEKSKTKIAKSKTEKSKTGKNKTQKDDEESEHSGNGSESGEESED